MPGSSPRGRSSSLRRRKFSYLKGRRFESLAAKKRRRFLVITTALVSFFLFFLVGGSILGLIVFAYYSKDLPSPGKLVERHLALSTRIYDREGALLYDVYGEQNRTLIELKEVPQDLVDATLATEDADFYTHRGFDLWGIVRALYNIAAHHTLQGGSTITQQLVKNALLTPERTVTRKIKEMLLALQIEQKYTKDEILQMYLNEVSYGGQAWGVEAAAEMYFGKNVKDLTLAECVLLAGLPQKPSVYSPFGSYPENARRRQSYVLYLMTDKGWIGPDGARYFLSKKRAQAAKEEPLKYAQPGVKIKAPHFVMYVKRLLTERYGERLVEEGGLQVKTSLDLKMQTAAEKIVAEEIEKAKGLKVGNGALVALDPKTGEILAMVGSKDYFDVENGGNFNVAVDGLRQPGSAIKPITYVTAFKKGYTAATMVMDVPTTFPGGEGRPDYEPENYDGKFRGPVQLRYALGNSINMAAVKVLKLVGIPSMLETAHEMGITTLNEPARYGLSLTLGGGEVKLLDLTAAYGVFAAKGIYRDPKVLLEVKDSRGRVLEKAPPDREVEGKRVLSEEESYLISHILSDNNARLAVFGPHSPLLLPRRTAAVKTGTTDDKRDNWTVGFTPSLVVGVWVGNNDNSPMDKRLASGITGAAPIWHRAMVEFLRGEKDEAFERPAGIVEYDIDSLTGMLPYETAKVRKEIFIKGTVPTTHSDMYTRLKICRADGKIAGRACEASGDYEEKVFVKLKDPLPEWQPFVDRWLEENKERLLGEHPEWYPPTEESALYFDESGRPSGEEKPLVRVLFPEDGGDVPSQFEVAAEVLSPFTVLKVEFYLDGDPVGAPVTSIPYKKVYDLGRLAPGKHAIKVLGYDSGGNVGEREVTVDFGRVIGGGTGF